MCDRKSRPSCQVPGCTAELPKRTLYHSRYRICVAHSKMPSMIAADGAFAGSLVRFCQQCGRFQPLEEFDGDKRSCRKKLEMHNAQRKRARQRLGGPTAAAEPHSESAPARNTRTRRRFSNSSDHSSQEALHARKSFDSISQPPVVRPIKLKLPQAQTPAVAPTSTATQPSVIPESKQVNFALPPTPVEVEQLMQDFHLDGLDSRLTSTAASVGMTSIKARHVLNMVEPTSGGYYRAIQACARNEMTLPAGFVPNPGEYVHSNPFQTSSTNSGGLIAPLPDVVRPTDSHQHSNVEDPALIEASFRLFQAHPQHLPAEVYATLREMVAAPSSAFAATAGRRSPQY